MRFGDGEGATGPRLITLDQKVAIDSNLVPSIG